MVLIPRDSGTPPAVSFSETARVDASNDAATLIESAQALSAAEGPDAKNAGLDVLVTLLTTHARALMAPETTTGGPSTTAATGTAPAAPATRASLVEQLSASASKRLAAAREADGGIARLLAAVGTSQLLHAERLAAAWQLPVRAPVPATGKQSPDNKAPAATTVPAATVPATTVPAATPTAAPCPSVSPTPAPSSATTDSALAAAVHAQQEAVYAYQVALKRLADSAATAATKDLQVHMLLLRQAEALTRANCGDVPATTAGYQLPQLFTQDPAAALGALEASSLPVYGDLVALSTGETRDWAVDGLMAAARRSIARGAALPALPGLKLDAGELPSLPTSGPAPAPAASSNAG